MTPFALAIAAVPRDPEPDWPYSYDPFLQLNYSPDGQLAAHNYPLLLSTATTVSSAGSKRHCDDA
jgi:hypothetical protein